MRLPLLAFAFKLPSDGLPVLNDWISHAQSIWTQGYECWESLEFKPLSRQDGGKPMAFGCLECVKGIGRISILLFGALYTYIHFKNAMTADEMLDFKRPLRMSECGRGSHGGSMRR